jgi:glyceraldehyde 3-phosphate dehydrogenase
MKGFEIMKPRTGINGFGRIGRLVTRAALTLDNIEIAAINDPSLSPEMIAYLLEYDSVHGPLGMEVTYDEHSVTVGSSRIRCYSTREPAEVPWAESGADYVVESTGVFLSRDKALAHKTGGAKYIVMSAPPKDDTPMFVMGVNHEEYAGQDVVSNASCTTNCLAPLARIVHENFGIEKGLMTTVHAATATQATVDSASKKDPRSGRAAFSNIIPSSTGAAKAVGKVLPALRGRLTGMAFRVPVADVSVVDLTVLLQRPATYEQVCAAVREASRGPMGEYVAYTDRPMVSSDFITNPHGCIFDATAGLAIDDTFMKLVAWYDNEYGYSANVTRLIAHMAAYNGAK